MVILIQDPVPTRLDTLMTRTRPAHTQRRVHMHIMARHVDRNQALEQNGPARPGRAQEDEQTRRGASIRDHIQDGAEGSRLIEVTSCIPVQGVEETRNTVENRAGARMKGHVVQRGDGEDDTGIAYTTTTPSVSFSSPCRRLGRVPTDQIRRKQKHILLPFLSVVLLSRPRSAPPPGFPDRAVLRRRGDIALIGGLGG